MQYPNRLLARITAPGGEPITLAEAKLYLRVDGSSEDAFITDLIVAARLSAEQWLKKSLLTQSWRLSVECFDEAVLPIPMGPVQEIVSVVLTQQDGSSQTLDEVHYSLNAAKNELLLNSLLATSQLHVTYVAGYADAGEIPRPIKLGILNHIASLYDNRGDLQDAGLPASVMSFYHPFREVRL